VPRLLVYYRCRDECGTLKNGNECLYILKKEKRAKGFVLLKKEFLPTYSILRKLRLQVEPYTLVSSSRYATTSFLPANFVLKRKVTHHPTSEDQGTLAQSNSLIPSRNSQASTGCEQISILIC